MAQGYNLLMDQDRATRRAAGVKGPAWPGRTSPAGRLAPLALALACAACGPKATPARPARVVPTPTVQVGACGDPLHDGVMSASPKLERADRDLNGDGTAERIMVDQAMCTPDGNCYWNVF